VPNLKIVCCSRLPDYITRPPDALTSRPTTPLEAGGEGDSFIKSLAQEAFGDIQSGVDLDAVSSLDIRLYHLDSYIVAESLKRS
jgi:hypothetical protein